MPAPEGASGDPAPPTTSGGARVEAFDLLRGLCAIGVAVYHALGWLGVAHVYNLGLYGVYVFFLLSGASMSIAYAPRLRRGYPIWKYLAIRYVRLAPLFIALVTYELALAATASGGFALIGKWLLNVTFLFGFANPGESSLATGGWSLGIEFVFYFVFPLMLSALSTRAAVAIVTGCVALQIVFVNVAIGTRSLTDAWIGYTQFAAFVGYFAAGVWIGNRWLADPRPGRRPLLRWALWLAVVVSLVTQSGATDSASLVGLRGALLTLLSVALVALSVRLRLPRPLSPIATWFGEASYPMYLVHPIVFRYAIHANWLQAYRTRAPALLAAAVVAFCFVLGIAIYRGFEEPILRWGKRRLA